MSHARSYSIIVLSSTANKKIWRSCDSQICSLRDSRRKEPTGCPLRPCHCADQALPQVSASKSLNKVTLPAELAEALADKGGLKNCGVQLVNFDLQVSRKLEELKKQLGGASKQMGDYFARANEFQFNPDTDEDDGRQSTIQALPTLTLEWCCFLNQH